MEHKSTIDLAILQHEINKLLKIRQTDENGKAHTLPSGFDVNELVFNSSRYYRVENGANMPKGTKDTSFLLRHIDYRSSGYAKQIAISLNSNRIFMRTFNNSVFSEWEDIFGYSLSMKFSQNALKRDCFEIESVIPSKNYEFEGNLYDDFQIISNSGNGFSQIFSNFYVNYSQEKKVWYMSFTKLYEGTRVFISIRRVK